MRISFPSNHRISLPRSALHDTGPEVPASSTGQHSLHCPATSLAALTSLRHAIYLYPLTAHCMQVSEPLLARVTLTAKSGTRWRFRTECFGRTEATIIDGTAIAIIKDH